MTNRKRVYNRLFLVLAAVFIVTLGVMIYTTRTNITQIVNQLSLDRTESAKEGLESYLDGLSSQAMLNGALIARQDELISALRDYYADEGELTPAVYERVKSVINEFLAGYDFISISDNNGIAVARVDNGEWEYPLPPFGYDLKSNPDVRVVLETGRGVDSLTFMLDNTTLVATTLFPIHHNGELLGVVTCLFNLSNPKYLEAFKEQTGCDAAVFLGRDVLFVSTFRDVADFFADSKAAEAIFDEGKASYAAFGEVGGRIHGVHYSPLTYHGEVTGMFFTGVDVDIAFANRLQMNLLMLMIAAVGLCIMVVLIMSSARFGREIDEQIERQLLMTKISQRFLGYLENEEFDSIIARTFEDIAGIMGASQILLYKKEPQSGDNKPVFICSNEWRDPKLRLESRLGAEFVMGPLLVRTMDSLKNQKKFYICSDDEEFRDVMREYRVTFNNYLSSAVFVNNRLYAILDFSRGGDKSWKSGEINTAAFVSNILSNAFQRQNIELQLIKAKELAEQSSQYKSMFVANMSHEIRTPINAILGISELQLADSLLPERVKDAFSRISESGELLLNIINDILDFSKIEAGKVEIVCAPYEIPSLINDSVMVNYMRYESKRLDFTLNLDPDTPRRLIGDELRLKQVLNNLLSNAFKYTDRGSVSMTVFAEKIRGGHNLVFSVKDTGQGMTTKQVSMIFEDYTRFNLESNRFVSGTGLGMSITKHLIDLMDGTIEIDSNPGEGSTFTVTIPQQSAGSGACGAEIAEKINKFDFADTCKRRSKGGDAGFFSGKVLVVDDIGSNLYVASGFLTLFGLSVETAISGFEAIDKVNALNDGGGYDIIFLDHMMPGMDGIETVKKLRDSGYTRPIVALTANAVKGQEEVFLANGFDAFLPKPINLEQMKAVLMKYVKRAESPASPLKAENVAVLGAADYMADPEIRGAFLIDITKTADTLRVLRDKGFAGNEQALITAVHGVKTVLRNMGEVEAAEKAFRIETAARDGDFADIDEFLQVLDVVSSRLSGAGALPLHPVGDSVPGPLPAESLCGRDF